MPESHSSTPCVSCGHGADHHDGLGGTCTSAGCGCSRFWDRERFDEVLDLGDPPAPPIADPDR